jgi:hypothetical protein
MQRTEGTKAASRGDHYRILTGGRESGQTESLEIRAGLSSPAPIIFYRFRGQECPRHTGNYAAGFMPNLVCSSASLVLVTEAFADSLGLAWWAQQVAPGYNAGDRQTVPGLEYEGFMTILARLQEWKEQGKISPLQHAHLAGLARGEPFSLFLELNVLLYAGVLAFVAGLGWTVSTWSHQIGDVVVLTVLSTILAASFWYCFSRAPSWSPGETPASSPIVLNPIIDYVLYLGSLVWSLELAYVENRFHLLSGQWDLYLLATAVLFFFLAYRFDNRFVLSLALSSLAGWFGLTISHRWVHEDAQYRQYALLYCLVVGVGGALLQRRGLKPHFFGTYLNIVANVLFWAVLSGVFIREGYGLWVLALLIACVASLAWGLTRRQFAFVAYAAVYGYVGLSSLILRDIFDTTAVLTYFVFSGIAMLVMLIYIGRRFGRSA